MFYWSDKINKQTKETKVCNAVPTINPRLWVRLLTAAGPCSSVSSVLRHCRCHSGGRMGTRWGWRLRCAAEVLLRILRRWRQKRGRLAAGFSQQQAAQPLNPNTASPVLLHRAAGAATRGGSCSFLRVAFATWGWINDAFFRLGNLKFDLKEYIYHHLSFSKSPFVFVFYAMRIIMVVPVHHMYKKGNSKMTVFV